VGENAAILPGEVAIVLGAHPALFAIDTPLLVLYSRGFARRELAAANALTDAILLIVFPLVDGGGPAVRLGEDGGWRQGEGCNKGKECKFHGHFSCISRAGLDPAASAYGGMNHRANACVAQIKKSIFLLKPATLLGILCLLAA
jgi:hypothetical protein